MTPDPSAEIRDLARGVRAIAGIFAVWATPLRSIISGLAEQS